MKLTVSTNLVWLAVLLVVGIVTPTRALSTDAAAAQLLLEESKCVKCHATAKKKDGPARPMGAISAFGAGGDSAVILPENIDTTTNQFNTALNYAGEKLFGSVAYYGSLFDNKVKGMTWQDPKTMTAFPSISTSPSNQFHEVNFTGGYNFAPATKLVLNAGYGRATQNEAFLTAPSYNPAAFESPERSAHAEVITKSFDMKLTARLL